MNVYGQESQQLAEILKSLSTPQELCVANVMSLGTGFSEFTLYSKCIKALICDNIW